MSVHNIGFLPVAMLEQPYAQPHEPGGDAPLQSARETVGGAGWNADWRGETFVPDTYQGYGEGAALPAGGQPTDWNSYTGLSVSQPLIRGYSGADSLQTATMAELRAGSTIGFPTSGQAEPGSDPVLLEIPFDQGMDVGWQQWMQQGRRMLFEQPLDYSSQTSAIPAVGWP